MSIDSHHSRVANGPMKEYMPGMLLVPRGYRGIRDLGGKVDLQILFLVDYLALLAGLHDRRDDVVQGFCWGMNSLVIFWFAARC